MPKLELGKEVASDQRPQTPIICSEIHRTDTSLKGRAIPAILWFKTIGGSGRIAGK